MEKSKYIHFNENKQLLFSTLSGSVIKLDKEKYNAFINNDFSLFSVEEIEMLLKMSFVHLFKSEDQAYNKNKINNKGVKNLGLTIMTTTNCNARCIYCYQQKSCKSTMSLETAKSVVDFINEYKPKLLHITWFGGEPLLNTKVIDEITSSIDTNNINLKSTIITNGYLIDKNLDNFVNKWKIRSAQITIDGVGEIYNKTKNFVNDKDCAFNKTISNVELLLKNNINVSVRLNFNKDNYLQILECIDYLYNKFGLDEHFKIYANHIYGGYETYHLDDGTSLYKIIYSKLIDYGYIKKISDLRIGFKNYHCFTQNPNHFVIDPKGDLYRCEHAILDESNGKIGSINDKELNIKNYNKWGRRDYPKKKCNQCIYKFLCRGGCKYERFYADYNFDPCLWIVEIIDFLLEKLYK